jgi:hypothetical protein
MLHESVFRNARTAERMRRMIRKQGHAAGHPLWTEREDDILRASYPDYKKARRRLPRRTYYALRNRVQELDIQKRRHIWRASEISRLRKLYTYANSKEIRSEFPFATWRQIEGVARHYKIRRPRRRLCSTSIPVLDLIRGRCYELGYSMVDLDSIAKTGKYFQTARWHSNRRLSGKYVCRAIEALGGSISVVWDD